MSHRKEIYEKYFNSNIFTQNPSSPYLLPKKIKVRESQTSLTKTKEDLFNLGKLQSKENISKSGIKRQKAYSKIYGSDIFFQNKKGKYIKREGVKMIDNKTNFSSVFNEMKNNEEFKNDIKNYTIEHRREKQEYDPDKYYLKDSASEIYYKQMYDSEGSSIIRERPFSASPDNKKKYSYNKKYLKRDLRKLNDCGADKKRNHNEINSQLTERKIYPKKVIFNYTDKKVDKKKYIQYKKITPQTACKLNKRANLTSHIFKENEKDFNKDNIKNLKTERNPKTLRYRDEYYHLGAENSKRDLTNNDPRLWGAIHSKWTRSKIDWSSPETEIMFGNTFSQEMKKCYGDKGPNCFQRMVHHMADSQNADTITGIKNEPITNLEKRPSEKIINDSGYKKVQKMLNEIPNLKEGEKFKIKNNATTALIDGEGIWNKKVKSLNKFYTNKDKIKVNRKENKEKNGNDISEYLLTYSVKGPFEKFNEKDIKLMFVKKGVHIYHIQKNLFDKGTLNTIKFTLREEKGENMKNKINEIKKDLEKQNCKVSINKKGKTDARKKMKNIITNPRGKLGILNENIGNLNNNNKKFTKMPEKIRAMHSFSKEFKNIDYKYKNNNNNKK